MREPPSKDNSDSPSTLDSDQFVRESISRLRTRLLDLTTRNPLISFKHSSRSRRYIRVIDELPDTLYSKLDAQRLSALTFKSLGDEPDSPDDEKTIQFRRALDAAKLEDREYISKISESGDSGDKVLERLERELRDRVRTQLGMLPCTSTASLSAADIARRRGLDPSFDLPASTIETEAPPRTKNADSAIQTLLFADAAERTLARINDQVRLSVDEAGVNPLFCVFGFLEWYEDLNSETPLHAPLLLHPLEMKRELVRGNYQYKILSSGEGTTVNVALAERLKRDFEIELPPFDEEQDTPESYFLLIQKVIERQKHWRVRRWVTVGLFSFARIAMYRDMDPELWKSEGGLDKHPALCRVVAGATVNDVGIQASVPEDDHARQVFDSAELKVPLIADADSSQLAAIRDVLSGASLVIQGPPGTGKSQTITNIIAAAMAAGKTVLFVAEKMAALNVVRDRLKDASLEPFCLELHSTKTSRQKLSAAFAQRLKIVASTRGDTELTATVARLETIRAILRDTVKSLGEPAGELGFTVQELLWRCHRVKSRTTAVPIQIDGLSLPNANRITNVELGRIVAAAERFAQARSAVIASHGSVNRHPWYGIARHDIDVFQAEDAVQRVALLAEAAASAERAAEAIASLTGWSITQIKQLKHTARAAEISPPDSGTDSEIVARMADPQTLATLEGFVNEIEEHSILQAVTAAAFINGTLADLRAIGDLCYLHDAAKNAELTDIKASEVKTLGEQRRRQADALERLSRLLSEMAAQAGWSAPLTSETERTLVAAVELAGEAGPQIIAGRTPSLIGPGALDVLRRGSERASSLRDRRDQLALAYAIPSANESDVLRRHALALRNSPRIPLFSPSYWSARSAFKGICKKQVKLGRIAMSAALDEIAAIKEDMAAFTANEELASCAGSVLVGIDSDLSHVLHVAGWADRVRQQLPAAEGASIHLRRLLLEGPLEQVEILGAIAKKPAFCDLKKALSSGNNLGIGVQAEGAEYQSQQSALAEAALTRLHLIPDWKLSDCHQLANDLKDMYKLRDGLTASKIAGSVLGGRFEGYRTNTIELKASAKHARAVGEASLPIELRDWLLQSNAVDRLTAMRPVATQAGIAAAEVEAATDNLTNSVPVDFSRWLGANSALDTNATELKEHATRCSKDSEGFHALIDDLRSLHEACEAGLKPLLHLFETQQVSLQELGNAARRVIYQSVARGAIASSAALVNFNGDRYEEFRKEFRELDHKLKRLRQTKIANDLASRPIAPGTRSGPKNQWTGQALIRNEAEKEGRFISARDLLDRAGKAAQQLMPCFMMSPLTVAQFLSPGKMKFDIVIMDEASQLRPQDAMGAIARGSQIVIVGDPKQLPPTNFFMGSDGDGPDNGAQTAADEKSILDHAISIFSAPRRLLWHYRSRHPSLIAFSNREFYANELLTFPSPYHDHPDFGVKYVHVAEGQFGGRVNLVEAQRVAFAASEYAAKHPDRSLGIVTLNQPQAELVGMEMDRIAAQDENFDAWRRKWETTLERFFVKNLENVQGDERDVIFISTVYGRNEQGNFYQRFGPINNEGGHRRLNVLFTRAKFQTIVFSSMDATDIQTTEESQWGVRALKGYLRFAKDGLLESPIETGAAPDSDFEVAVIEQLRSAGFEPVPQVGVVGYFIDVAVRHPQRRGEFVLGIECDGAMYHSAKSARDRDRLRQEILERLHWRIHRIWSLDWYRNPKRETERLLKAVREAVAAAD